MWLPIEECNHLLKGNRLNLLSELHLIRAAVSDQRAKELAAALVNNPDNPGNIIAQLVQAIESRDQDLFFAEHEKEFSENV